MPTVIRYPFLAGVIRKVHLRYAAGDPQDEDTSIVGSGGVLLHQCHWIMLQC
jgi:hypothetical protein